MIDETASCLLRLGFDKVEQLTFLDPLDVANTVDGSNAKSADNYYSALRDSVLGPIGSPIKNAYNKDLGLHPHEYPVTWYTETIADPVGQEGFYWSGAGNGGSQQNNHLVTLSSIETFDTLGNWKKSGNVYFLDGTAYLEEASPAFLFEDILIPSDVNFLSFGFKFIDPGDGDLLKLFFDDQFLFGYEGIYFQGDNFMNSGMIDISRFSGRNGKLIFELDNFGEANARIGIDNLSFFQSPPVPEPSTYLLLIIGLFDCLGLKRKQTR